MTDLTDIFISIMAKRAVDLEILCRFCGWREYVLSDIMDLCNPISSFKFDSSIFKNESNKYLDKVSSAQVPQGNFTHVWLLIQYILYFNYALLVKVDSWLPMCDPQL